MNQHTEMSPNELGRRFLAMIKEAKSFKDLSANAVQRSIGKPFDPNGTEENGFYTLNLPGGDWQYSVIYNFDEKFSEYSNVSLKLIESRNSENPPQPPCDLPVEEYVRELKSAGFTPQPESHNEIGRLLSVQYTRDDMFVQIIPQDQASKTGQLCIETISVREFGE
ncbi:hypothetical protein [Xanthomonas bundabergensis]|uniref:hypothetical protein n=1 Tax=Xanthomonas bundabergensis TaxID=3160842 RepID=UPI0035164CA6